MSSKSGTLVVKVSQPVFPLCNVRFMQVGVPKRVTRVSEQIESAMGKGGTPL